MSLEGETKWLIANKRQLWPHSLPQKVPLVLPEKEGPRPLDIPLTVALDAGLKDEGVGVEVVVRGDRAVLAATAGVLHHHRHWQGDTAEVLWRKQQPQNETKP